MTFDRLGSEENSILLCKNCHTQFDDSSNPGFVFLPSDLQYFIDFEKADYKTREQILHEKGFARRRTCPTAEDYETHLRATQHLTGGVGFGGLYHVYILRRYFGKYGNQPWMPGRDPTGPKQWHGAPMAAIRRGLSALGGMVCQIPPHERHQLRELQDLYSLEPEPSSPEATAGTDKEPLGNQVATGDPAMDAQPGTTDNPVHPSQLEPATARAPNTAPQPHDDEVRRSQSDSAIDLASARGTQNPEGKRYGVGWSCKDVVASGNEYQQHRRSNKRKRDSVEEEYAGKGRWRWGPSSSSNDKLGYGRKTEHDRG